MKEGYSKIRNRGIASAFSYMKIIEGWGSGIPRMLEECREYGLREPELIDAEGDFRINLYRNNAIDSAAMPYLTEKVPESAGECRRVPESAGLILSYCRNSRKRFMSILFQMGRLLLCR